MRKVSVLYGISTLALILVSATASNVRTSKADKPEVVIRQQPNGEWQMFVFGPRCEGGQKNMQVIYPVDATQPIEVECDLVSAK